MGHPRHTCTLEWGARGAQHAAMRGDIVVIVDTLRFSTTVATAVHRGACIRPSLARTSGEGGAPARFSLSPLTFLDAAAGQRVPLYSANGALCARVAAGGTDVLVGTLVNARAVAAAVTAMVNSGRRAVTVVPCGERQPDAPDSAEIRMAVEDYLGAGAILAYLPFKKSPEALVCEGAFVRSATLLENLLWECESGVELRERGQSEDILHAAQLNAYDTAAVMVGDWLVGQSHAAVAAMRSVPGGV